MNFEQAENFIIQKLKNELPAELSYHSIDHINDVYSASKRLAEHEGINGDELKLLLTAALFHDSGFLVQRKDHEAISCQIAKQYLPGFGYSNEEIELICGMIMATKLPQSPKTKLEEILCDADLDYLGREDFYETGTKLFKEFLRYGVVRNEEEWNVQQLKFLEAHHYFTDTAIKLRKQKKDAHLDDIRKQAESYS